MPRYDFDLFTIGAGSGGVRASRFAAGFGARVAIAEERYLGGTCVNVGCIPKKLYSYASHVREEIHLAAGFGWSAAHTGFDLAELVANKNREILRLNGIYRRLLDKIAECNYDVFKEKVRLSRAEKVGILTRGLARRFSA